VIEDKGYTVNLWKFIDCFVQVLYLFIGDNLIFRCFGKHRQHILLKRCCILFSAQIIFSETPEDKIITCEEIQNLNKAVNELPEDYRIPLILYHFHDLSYKEICQVMDAPMSIVKNRLFRARKMLKETLTGGGFNVM
ncbi:MAG TPA: sigma-70 family RNA polymerase sigma factor, partial [Thermoanaerobacterales bacterium]|nr:sigma-70 family RNA polymerase sigma factor [Thermoanaerobacterales bacterium]